MIEVFKITHDIYDSDASLKLVYHSSSVTRGNKYNLLWLQDLNKLTYLLT